MGTVKFSISKTVWTDWPALAVSVGIPILWVIHFAFPLLRSGAESSPPVAIAIVGTGLCAIILAWRIHRVFRLFAAGRTAPATITRVKIVRDRGRLEFAFEHEGELVRSWTPVHKNKAVLALEPGDVVETLFDPNNPTTAIVTHLYVS